MTKYEKVVKGLELCRYDPDPGQECKALVSCDICPYWDNEQGCREVDLFNDALELLKDMNEKLVRTTALFRRSNSRYIGLLDELELERQENQ